MKQQTLELKFEGLSQNLMTEIPELISTKQCKEWIEQYERSEQINRSQLEDEVLDECQKILFVNDLDTWLKNYFNGNYIVHWSMFDTVDSSANNHNYNTRWHCDGGVRNTLKLFVYLNSVTEHGGNTLLMDKPRTDKLREYGHLPLELKLRKLTLNEALLELSLPTDPMAYNLNAGDGLLFDPIQLAHKCLAPTSEKVRYTLCYTVFPV